MDRWLVSLFGMKDAPGGYTLSIAVILWFTVLFANFAEAVAEGRGKAQADSLRASRKDVDAHKIPSADKKDSVTVVPSVMLKKGELVIVKAGEQIRGVDFDGNEIRKGAADAIQAYVTGAGGNYSDECAGTVREIAEKGGTPLVVAKNRRILGVIYLKDIIKQGVSESSF